MKRTLRLTAALLMVAAHVFAATSGTSIDQPITFFGNLVHGPIANLAFLGGSCAAVYTYQPDGFSRGFLSAAGAMVGGGLPWRHPKHWHTRGPDWRVEPSTSSASSVPRRHRRLSSAPARSTGPRTVMASAPHLAVFRRAVVVPARRTSADFLFDAIGSVRKCGGCFVGATPSTVELANSPFGARLLVNCPGQVFFANHMLRTGDAYVTEQYRQLGVPAQLITTIGGARRKRDLVYKEPAHARLAAFRLGRVGQRICGATGFDDIKRFRQLVATHGNDRDAVLAAWLAG